MSVIVIGMVDLFFSLALVKVLESIMDLHAHVVSQRHHSMSMWPVDSCKALPS